MVELIKPRPWLVAVAALTLVAAGMTFGPSPSQATSMQSLSIAVKRPSGPAVLLQFEVRASNSEQAYAAALSAAAQLIPGGTIVTDTPGVATAQWQPWGWTWDDSELPVSVAYNPTGAPPNIGPDAVINALDTWSNVPTSRFAYKYGGFTDRPASLRDSGPDGANVIAWQSLDCTGGCVLGVTTKETEHESDLILNSNPGANLGNGSNGTADARTVILHETGHMAGLEHSCPAPFGVCTTDEVNAVMYYQYRGIMRKLAADDIAGISALYPVGAPTPSATPPPSSAPPTLAQFFALEPGWNLVLLPSGPLGDSMPELSCADAVYRFGADGWKVWLRDGAPALLTLNTAEAANAYWVHADAECSHTFQ
ncbi:MAG: matrixin family metalloprotease [Tepidiformaceae bacterium]